MLVFACQAEIVISCGEVGRHFRPLSASELQAGNYADKDHLIVTAISTGTMPSVDKRAFAAELRSRRKAAALSQAALARELSAWLARAGEGEPTVLTQSIQQWEKPDSSSLPHGRRLRAVCQGLEAILKVPDHLLFLYAGLPDPEISARITRLENALAERLIEERESDKQMDLKFEEILRRLPDNGKGGHPGRK